MKSKFIEGLYQADTETLANFISIWDTSSISNIVSKKSIDIYEKIKHHEVNDNFSKTIIDKKNELLNTHDLNTMRTILILQLTKFFEIKIPKKLNLTSLEYIGLNIEHKSIEALKKADKEFQGESIESMIQYVFKSMFNNISESFKNSDENEKEKVAINIFESISKMPEEQQKKLKELLHIDEITKSTITKALASGTLGIALSSIISVAGFSAYTFAVSTLASTAGLIGISLPFGTYMGLTSMIAIVSSPIFLIGSMSLLVFILSNKSNDKIKGKLAPFVVSLISILSAKESKYISESENHINNYNTDIKEYLIGSPYIKETIEKKYINLNISTFENNPVFDISNQPSSIMATCDSSLDFLYQTVDNLNLHEKLSLLISKTYKPYINYTSKAISGITIGDLIYDMIRIDPLVVESIDFARKADIPDMFSLAYFSESIDIESIGQINQLKGYVAERLIAQQLQSYGYEVEFPATSNQAGYDLLVNGEPFQVKCGDKSYLVEDHFDKYPDIPVLVNEELGQLFPNSDNVFTIQGIRNDEITELTTSNLESSRELLDFEIPLITIAIISGKQMISVLQNKIDFQNAIGKAVEESTVRISGGIIGSNILMVSGAMIMPAAGIVGGMVGAILGSMTLAEMLNKFKIQKLLSKETELIDTAIKTLFIKSIEIGNNNLLIAKKKFNIAISKLQEKKQNEIIKYLTYRFNQECDYRKEKIALMEYVVKYNSLVLDPENQNILTSSQNAIVLIEQIGIHPFTIRYEFDSLMDAIQEFQNALNSSELTKYIKNHSADIGLKLDGLFGSLKKSFVK